MSIIFVVFGGSNAGWPCIHVYHTNPIVDFVIMFEVQQIVFVIGYFMNQYSLQS